MRKITLALALALALAGNSTFAQSDGFFNNWQNIDDNRDVIDNGIVMPGLPASHDLEDDTEAPLGSGLLILTALGAAYGVKRRVKS